jgi:hypothetical protein
METLLEVVSKWEREDSWLTILKNKLLDIKFFN